MKRAQSLRRAIFILLCACVGLLVTRFTREPYREFIVPQDYSGKLTILVDPNSSISIKNVDLLRYHFVIRFPADGVLRVNNAWGLYPMAHEEWKYPDGALLRATKTGPYPGRVALLNYYGVPTAPGTEYLYEILPEGETAAR
jgi:hypothetical protein